MKKEISLHVNFLLFIISLLITTISLLSLQYEFLLPDSFWIYTLAIFLPLVAVLLFSILRDLSRHPRKDTTKYLAATIGFVILAFLVIYNFHSLLVALGKAEPYDNDNASYEEDRKRFGTNVDEF